jgi:transitional endoplasmic reticulum ATPase
MIDSALLRSGRFDAYIELPIPDEKSLFEILKVHTRGKPLSNKINLKKVSSKISGFTGADVELLCNRASLLAIKSYIQNRNVAIRIKDSHFDLAIKQIKEKVESIFSSEVKKTRFPI